MKTIDRLLSASHSVWETYHQHPFIQGLQDGSLKREKFRHYILQDYLYLTEYAKVFAIGITKARSLPVMRLFSSYIQAIVDSEMATHSGYIGKLNIDCEELAQTPTALSNRSYTAYMQQMAYEGGEAEALTAILSCAYSYEAIGHSIVQNNPNAVTHPFYGDWVQYYSGEKYHQENLRLLDMLEDLTKDYTEQQLCHLEDIFVTCSRYESAFWDMAWTQSF
jgi:thiaminase/transcriptional activator TenA